MRLLNAFYTILLISICSCAYENREDEVQKNQLCEPLNMSFSENIKPILNSNCVSCHNINIANGGVNLQEFAQVKKLADNGKLVGVINHSPGFAFMPQGAAKLPECEILKIETWINEGAQNN